MTADWVAVTVRGRGLASRRLGPGGVRRLARTSSLAAALTELAHTPYGSELRPGMQLRAAQYAVCTTLVWHLRILAGWGRPNGAERVRRLAAGFEIANIVNHLARIDGRPADPPYALGALTVGWSQIARAGTATEVRAALAGSAWGDPGGEDLGVVRSALHAMWCRRVADAIPEARGWSVALAALLVARGLAGNAPLTDQEVVRRHLTAVLGSRWQTASTLAELADRIPRGAAWVLDGVRVAEDLWRAEARWWAQIDVEGLRLTEKPRPEPQMIVGLVARLAVDAWRTRGALELAARGGAEWSDAIA